MLGWDFLVQFHGRIKCSRQRRILDYGNVVFLGHIANTMSHFVDALGD